MHATVWVFVVVRTVDRTYGFVGSVTSTTATSLEVPVWLGFVPAGTPTRS
jgi:hypothetical protein